MTSSWLHESNQLYLQEGGETMASNESYERLMKNFDNLQRIIDDTRDGISKMERDN